MAKPIYDVILVGYGPVSASLALMLGRQGRSVAVCERWATRYPLPRAVCIDHELYRVLSANGMNDVLPSVTHPGPAYQWFNADWKELLVIDWSDDSISGGPEVNFVHQPTLEAALDAAVSELPNVDLNLGCEVIKVEQDDTLACVTFLNSATGAEHIISAHYVVGCDGANSIVRSAIGSSQEDRGFEADWLVIDVALKDGVTIEQLGIPGAGQYCNPLRPTTIVPAGVRQGRYFRRWEFMRLPGETNEELEDEARVWELLKPWAGPEHVELLRHKVYNFRSLIAEGWRDRRLLVAGDAAHVMPPFMGQGMCSGMRDAWNLAWKLGMVLDGKAGDRLLDSYEVERHPHVSAITDLSIYLGKIICIPDAEEAAARDAAFLTGTAEPPPPFPQLADGLLHRQSDGSLSPGAGLLSAHDIIRNAHGEAKLDEITGCGFALIAHGFDPPAVAVKQLDAAAPTLIILGDTGATDINGRLRAFLAANDWDAMIVRPDFYVYGGSSGVEGFARLADDFAVDIVKAGIRRIENAAYVSATGFMRGAAT